MKTIKICLGIWMFFGLASCDGGPGASPTPPAVPVIASPTSIFSATEPPVEPGIESIQSISQFGLAGSLVLIKYDTNGNALVELDLESGEFNTLFQAPEDSWLAGAAVSPDSQQVILVYAPPPPADEIQYGYTDLYVLSREEPSQPQPFLTRDEQSESFFLPSWTPDGQSVYYTHLRRIDPDSEVPAYQNDVEKTNLDGESQTIVENALWPVISPDGLNLSYLSANPFTFSNDLYLANPDGSAQTPVFEPGVTPPVDAHIFSQDGSQLIFSMVNFQPAPASTWFEKLLGVAVASAHNVPSDWYLVPASGGNRHRLTNLNEVNLIGDLSPDGTQLAFICAGGLYIMNIDGSGLIQLIDDIFIGTIDWIP